VIQEVNPNGDSTNTIQFGSGISPEDLLFTRRGVNLEIGNKNNTDTITINQWYNSCGKIDFIQFDNGTIWTQTDITRRAIAIENGTDGDDSFTGFDSNDIFTGGPGNDTLSGVCGNDTYIQPR